MMLDRVNGFLTLKQSIITPEQGPSRYLPLFEARGWL